MGKKEAPITTLQHYLPEGTFDAVVHYLNSYHVHLTIARDRKSILGDYRHRLQNENHRISVNGNLNKYSFLLTLLHELAHLLTFEEFGNKVNAHGKEWKTIFGQLLAQFIQHNIFPDDIKRAVLKSIHNPAASSCSDEHLLRILKKYDEKETHLVFVESIPEGTLFKTHDGKIFKKGEKIRKRYKCVEVKTKKMYLFSAVYEVEALS
jgi:SprT protein